MKVPRNTWMLAGCSAAGVLIVGAVIVLISGRMQANRMDRMLAQSLTELQLAHELNPFPTDANVAREVQSTALLNTWYTNLLSAVRQGGIRADEQRPSFFMELLGRTRRSLMESAPRRAVDPAFVFGFERYFASGSPLPSPTHVPQLTRQLLTIERICRVLYEARILRLTSVKREEVELAQDSVPPVSPPLYTKQHYGFEFEATEPVLRAVLGRLATEKLFMVVSALEVTKARDDLAVPTPTAAPVMDALPAEAAAPGAPKTGVELYPKGLTRQQRVVCGPEVEVPLTVVMQVDVYHF